MARYSYPDDLGSLLDDILRRLKNLEVSPRLTGASINAAEGATVVKNDQGIEVLRIGRLATGDIGVIYKRQDGVISFAQYAGSPDGVGGSQFWAWYDHAGNIIFSDDIVSGQGLARPYMEHGPWVNLNQAQVNSATTTTWTDLYTTVFVKQHPLFDVQVLVYADSTTTGGNVRLMLDGTQVGNTINVASNSYTYQRWSGLACPGNHLTEHQLTLQTQLVGGTGNVRAQPVMFYGRQT